MIKQYFVLIILILLCSFNFSCSKEVIKGNTTKPKRDSVKTSEDTTENGKRFKYAVAKYFTPVLYTKDFKSVYGGSDGKTLKRAGNGLIKELEYVAYPGTVFEILDEYIVDGHRVLKVITEEYDIVLNGTELFIDSRFTDLKSDKPEERKKVLPSKKDIYKYFDSSIGALYVWGANNLAGVPQMLEFYKPKGKLSEEEQKEWELKGVDCSGLIYEATNGYTARNTHQLVNYGDAVEIERLTASQIVKKLDSLDLIVWKGHVIIVYDKNTTIESLHSAGGVIKKNLSDVIGKLMKTRTPINEWGVGGKKNAFVVRRWYKK